MKGVPTYCKLKTKTKNEVLQIIKYLDNTPFAINLKIKDKKFLLFHGGINKNIVKKIEEDTELEGEEIEVLLWDREWFNNDNLPKDYIYICGHTPKYIKNGDEYTIWQKNNIICLDMGQIKLPCLRLDDMKVFYVE